MSELKTVTRSEIRMDSWGKVTGETQFVDDLSLENLLHGVVVRSPHHHARIVRISTEAAKRLDGVVAVLTADDVPGTKTFGAMIPDRPVLAFDVVRHKGEPVALVVAESKLVAQRGLKAVEAEYEELPSVFEPVKALRPDAARLHPNGNLITEYDLGCGDVEAGLAQSDVVLEETFRVPRVSPAYLEPEVAAARLAKDGTLSVWASSQQPFHDRDAICAVLNLPEEQVHVRVGAIGGAFGGKVDASLPILAALAAWAIKGTVKLVNTREESIQAHPKRHAGVLHTKMGADGKLIALSSEVHLDTGAYASFGPAVGALLSEVAPGPYRTPNVRVRTKVVYTNGPFAGAMRGFGAPQALFAVESMMDMMAAELGMDPIQFRRKNLWRQGERTPLGVLLREAPSLVACLERAAQENERLRQAASSPGKSSGVGVAAGIQPIGAGYGVPDDSTSRVEWLPDGRVRLDVGAPDMGQGTLTVAAQVAAEALGIGFESVQAAGLDTSVSPDGGMTVASRMTYMVGNAVQKAASRMIEVLLDEAAKALSLPCEELSYRGGRVYRGSDDAEGISVAEFTSRAAEEGRVMSGEATFSFPYPPEITPEDLPPGLPHVLFCYSAHVARVEVDSDLGTIDVKEIVAIHDVGRAINPVGVEGQIVGGVAMGVGYALQEEVKLKDDGGWTDSFTEYLLPTTLDTPHITPIILEYSEPSGPFGARGVGEAGVGPVAPAIANAVADATGVRVTSLPIRPEALVGD
jgi:CO/xanthine dehydrogenase Mo-binding subunit